MAAARATAGTLRDLASEVEITVPRLEDLERRLTVLEEKLFAVLLAATGDDEIVAVRAEADRELSPYRRKMPLRRSTNCRSSTCTRGCWKSMGYPA